MSDNLFIKYIAVRVLKCDEFFDASSADVTARVLEAWAETGWSLKEKHVRRAINYFRFTQTKFGAWEGRWGFNYI